MVIYGQFSWAIFDLKGKLVEKKESEGEWEILELKMLDTLENYSLVTWQQEDGEGKSKVSLELQTFRGQETALPLAGHTVVTTNSKQNRAFICRDTKDYTVSAFLYQV